MTPNFDWIPDGGLKAEIIQAWEEYQRHPEVWRLNHYLSLVESVQTFEKKPKPDAVYQHNEGVA